MLPILLSVLLAILPPVAIAEVTPQTELNVPSVDQIKYLAEIIKCESNGKTDIKVLDTNNRYSYGAFQFQMATFLAQSKLYHLDNSKEEIYNLKKQLELAHLMLLDNGEHHWTNCTRPLGKYPKVSIK